MDTFILFPIYYIYNTAIMVALLVLHRRYGDVILRITIYVIFVTLFVQVAASFAFRSVFRGSLFFNNPNQLGYYALLSACIIALTQHRLGLRRLVSSAALTSCAYLSVLSASRAATLGILILLFFQVFANPRVIILASIAALGLVAVGGPISEAIDSAEQRATANRNPDVSFFEERGYDRIWTNKQYLLLGAGEGGLSRFADTSRVKNMEIHSSAGMVLFSYGLVGSGLFLWFLWRVVAGARLRMSLMLIPPLSYTIAHQGLRFTMLWVLLGIFVILKSSPGVAPRAPPSPR
jgi:hypothetical protein